MSDAMDSNIKVEFFYVYSIKYKLLFVIQSMYTMMAKAEEVTESMKLIESYSTRMYPL